MAYELYLYHHGRKGMHWGVKNGPPYPLGQSIVSGYIQKQKKKMAEKAVDKQQRKNANRLKRGDYDDFEAYLKNTKEFKRHEETARKQEALELDFQEAYEKSNKELPATYSQYMDAFDTFIQTKTGKDLMSDYVTNRNNFVQASSKYINDYLGKHANDEFGLLKKHNVQKVAQGRVYDLADRPFTNKPFTAKQQRENAKKIKREQYDDIDQYFKNTSEFKKHETTGRELNRLESEFVQNNKLHPGSYDDYVKDFSKYMKTKTGRDVMSEFTTNQHAYEQSTDKHINDYLGKYGNDEIRKRAKWRSRWVDNYYVVYPF